MSSIYESLCHATSHLAQTYEAEIGHIFLPSRISSDTPCGCLTPVGFLESLAFSVGAGVVMGWAGAFRAARCPGKPFVVVSHHPGGRPQGSPPIPSPPPPLQSPAFPTKPW